jgi:hypothetical protein
MHPLKDKSDPELQSSNGLKGYYGKSSCTKQILFYRIQLVRPSRAIEKGGGFYVPGLEDGKIRVVSAVVLLGFFALNSSGLQHPSLPISVSTVTGVIVCCLLFLQGVSDMFNFNSKPAEESMVRSFINLQPANNQVNLSLRLSKISELLLQTISGLTYVSAIELEPATSGNFTENKTIKIRSEWGKISQNPMTVNGNVLSSSYFVEKQNTLFVFTIKEFRTQFPTINMDFQQADISAIAIWNDETKKLFWILGFEFDSKEKIQLEEIYIKSLLSAPNSKTSFS